MAYTLYNGGELPNLVNVTQRMDPDGAIASIAEILEQYNPIIKDIPMYEGNLPVGHRTTVRTDIPSPTWRKLNYGVRPTKSLTKQVDEPIGMCEDYGEVDKEVAMLNGNTAKFRLSEDMAHVQGMSNEMASTIFYGDPVTDPEKFHGIAPRFDSLGNPADPVSEVASTYLKHVLNGAGTTANIQTSVYYVKWGEQSVHGVYPKGSKAGLMQQDLGEVTLFDNDGGRYQGYRTHYQWKLGLVVKDWRYIVRVANIELSLMETTANQQALYRNMIKAMYVTPQDNMARGVFYASPGVMAMLDIAAVEKSNAALGYAKVFGEDVLAFRGVPIRPCSAILETEAVLT